MPKLNQKGAIQFIVLIILLLGIAGGVFLATRKESFKIFPKASETKHVLDPYLKSPSHSSSLTITPLTLTISDAATTISDAATGGVDVEVPVIFSGAQSIAAAQVVIKYDKEKLSVVDSRPGSPGIQVALGDCELPTLLFHRVDESTGIINVARGVAFGDDSVGVDGCQFINIRFKPLQTGIAKVEFVLPPPYPSTEVAVWGELVPLTTVNGQVTVATPNPDLLVNNISVLGTPRVGRSNSLNVAVENTGDMEAKSDKGISIGVTITKPDGTRPDGTSLGTCSGTINQSLKPKDKTTVQIRNCPKYTVSGSHQITATIDSTKSISESNEDNNSLSTPVIVGK